MFFSEDLLVAKRGSLGIIWLVSTLGPRNKRVTRKALANVEIPRTCELIAQPPEPLALRLSGQLLVGVARVYNQNYENFYTDVQSFDHALRHSIAVNFGAAQKSGGVSGGIDLPGGGKTRLDLITFGEVDPSLAMFSGLDFEYGHINWFEINTHVPHPSRSVTPRLDSLTASVHQRDASEDPEVVDARPSKRLRLPTSEPPRPPSYKPSSQPLPAEDNHNFEPMNIFDDLPNVPSSDGPMPFDDLPFEQNADIDLPAITDDPVNVPDGIRTPSAPSSPKRKRDTSSEELSDVSEDLVPAPKKVKKPRIKKPTVDNKLELDDVGEVEYVEAMVNQRKENTKKRLDNVAGTKAQVMLDTAGNWVKFLDDDMNLFLARFTKVGTFKWQLDAKRSRNQVFTIEPPLGNGAPVLAHDENTDIYLDVPHDDDLPFIPDIPDIPDLPIDMDVPEPEAGRDVNARESILFPWQMDDTPPHSFSPDLNPAPSSGFSTPDRLSLTRNSPSSVPRRRQSRSVSLSSNADPSVTFLNLNSDDFNDNTKRISILDRVVPAMLVTLEVQCQQFLRRAEKMMADCKTDEIELSDMITSIHVESERKRKVASTAFYNCLTLATKCMLEVAQDVDFGPIRIRLAA